ncbi:pyrroline-5-carboxylate reductase [Advenella mimigardefordensis]|uniref:Pyrroline-5-carboxylate reductase n=1 Tax=Advenella mimigardefordensis (strain DSM 17166 / LMG 22922 / DPN7) TaxID=1247726 RepID=W0PFY6_ADVMD|nr:pyrroline-5-carboxylate reductase [Advenella mimigardefordensis]AHG63988.1 pyrroline-5-carboxylate reductase [Advenella mimigardefordensis DPN7]
MKNSLTIAFIGGGNMAGAMLGGLLGNLCQPQDILVVDPGEATRAAWDARGVVTAAVACEALSQCKVWIYAVKPQVMQQAIEATRPFLQDDTLVISIAAGLPTTLLSGWLDQAAPTRTTRLIRCMPNTPALIRQGITGLYATPGVPAADRQRAQDILSSVGEAVWVDQETQLDAVTALSGSGPAYVFLFIESLIAGGISLGLDQEQAQRLALATLKGASLLAAGSDQSPARLRENVTSPGGTTAAALNRFAQGDFAGLVQAAMQAANDRAAQMAQESAAAAQPAQDSGKK